MRIISRATGKDVSVTQAVFAVTHNRPDLLARLITRLLEELVCNEALSDVQLQRVLEYAFKVERV